MEKDGKIQYGFFVTLLVFISGFCSLTYQVIWERTLKYSFGGDVISASIIVSVFLLGLGIGGFIFRKVKEKALVILALVELLIGVFGMWSYEIMLQINTYTEVLNQRLGMGNIAETFFLFTGTFIFLLIPTIFMGGTLPLMFESFIPKIKKNTKFIGYIYGINVLGAMAGALIPLLLFGDIGLPNTLKLISLLSILIGISLFFLVLKEPRKGMHLSQPEVPDQKITWGRKNSFIVAIAFISGFIALALEILFIRFIGIMHGSTSYSFPTIMSAYLLSMSLGSMFWSFLRDKTKHSSYVPFFLLLSVGNIVPLTLIFFKMVITPKLSLAFNFMNTFFSSLEAFENGNFLLLFKNLFQFGLPFFLLIMPVVFFSSGIFPTLIKNLSENKVSIGKSTGVIYFSNSVGSTLGSLLTGFIAIPLLGWHTTLVVISLFSVVMGLSGILCFQPRFQTEPREGVFLNRGYRWILILLVVIPLLLFALSDQNIKYKLATGKYTTQASIISYEEGVTGVAAVTKDETSKQLTLHVYSNGQYMSALPNHPRHAYLANLPRMQKKLRSVLLLGLGGGRSLADLLSDDRVKNIVAVDWSREIVKIVRSEPIKRYNRSPLEDDRVTMIMADARKVIRSYAQKSIKFDAIIDNLCFPHWPGAGGVKSIQFFSNIKEILNNNGYYYHINNFFQERDLILNTLDQVFDHLMVHNGMMVICGLTEFSPTEDQVLKILTEKNILTRAPNMFIPGKLQPDEYYSHFQKLLTKIDTSQWGDLQTLTDEVPLTEYFISLSFLKKKLRQASENGQVGEDSLPEKPH